MIRIFFLFLFMCVFSAADTSGIIPCTQESSLLIHKGPVYDFSVRILYRITHGRPHFVCSPLSSWLQLIDLSESTTGPTQEEIWHVTKYHKNLCFRNTFRDLLNEMDDELKESTKRRRLVIVDELLIVNHDVKEIIEKENAVTVMELSFNKPTKSLKTINEVLSIYKGSSDPVFDENIFNYNELLMINVAYSNNLWKFPFNPVQTKTKPFYSEDKKQIGEVQMMNQINTFNFIELPSMNVNILELPCLGNDRASLLIFFPVEGFVEDVFYRLRDIRLTTIFNLFESEGRKTVNVSLPRFKISSQINNLPELLNDMGIVKVFDLNQADFKSLSDFKMHASVINQMVSIDVTERGVNAIVEAIQKPHDVINFNVNRPFGFMLVDRKLDLILFAGIYSIPILY